MTDEEVVGLVKEVSARRGSADAFYPDSGMVDRDCLNNVIGV